jgi:Family of unknown function (DUF5759)
MEEEPRINIDELYETKKKSDINRLSIYMKLLKRIHNQIKMTSRLRENNQICYFIMPEVLIGYSNYDLAECLSYVMDRLNNDGFSTRYVHPNLLMISWSHWVPTYVRDEIKKKTGMEVDQYGVKKEEPVPSVRFEKTPGIKSVKSGGSSIYDDEFINSMRNI